MWYIVFVVSGVVLSLILVAVGLGSITDSVRETVEKYKHKYKAKRKHGHKAEVRVEETGGVLTAATDLEKVYVNVDDLRRESEELLYDTRKVYAALKGGYVLRGDSAYVSGVSEEAKRYFIDVVGVLGDAAGGALEKYIAESHTAEIIEHELAHMRDRRVRYAKISGDMAYLEYGAEVMADRMAAERYQGDYDALSKALHIVAKKKYGAEDIAEASLKEYKKLSPRKGKIIEDLTKIYESVAAVKNKNAKIKKAR